MSKGTARNAPIKILEVNYRNVERAVSRRLCTHRMLHLVQGGGLVVLGAIVFVAPSLGMFGLSILIGWVSLISGVTYLIVTTSREKAPDFWRSLLSAALSIVIGLTFLVMPVEGAFFLTILLIAFFIIQGAASIVLVVEWRRVLSCKWKCILSGSLLNSAVGMVTFTYLPSETAWAICGLLVGINIMIDGAALIIMVVHARKTLLWEIPVNAA